MQRLNIPLTLQSKKINLKRNFVILVNHKLVDKNN